MSPLRIEYSAHAAVEMRKAAITRQVIRRVLTRGRREPAEASYGDEGWRSTLRIENVTYVVLWVQLAGRVLIVTAYRLGQYD